MKRKQLMEKYRKKINKMINEIDNVTQYPYELSNKGNWRCTKCKQEMIDITEIKEHHKMHIGDEI